MSELEYSDEPTAPFFDDETGAASAAPSSRRRVLWVAVASVAAACLVAGGVYLFSVDREQAADRAVAEYKQSVAAFKERVAEVVDSTAAGVAVVSTAQTVLDGSDGKVFKDDLSRSVLTLAVADQNKTLESWSKADGDMVLPKGRPAREFWDGGAQFTAAAKKLDGLKFAKHDVKKLSNSLAAPSVAVAAAQAAWQAEQDRLNTIAHTEWVRTTGFQSQINACNGSVDITANYWGKPTVAEHWSCTGRDFPTTPGSIVEFTGVVSGKYEVVGIAARLNVNSDGIADVPTGFDLLYQTCWNGDSSDMTFTGLKAVGDGAHTYGD